MVNYSSNTSSFQPYYHQHRSSPNKGRKQQQGRRRQPLPPNVEESIDDSKQAEYAARKLEEELRSNGYDPQNGGRLLRKGSLESYDDDGIHDKDSYCDKYWQTPEQEEQRQQQGRRRSQHHYSNRYENDETVYSTRRNDEERDDDDDDDDAGETYYTDDGDTYTYTRRTGDTNTLADDTTAAWTENESRYHSYDESTMYIGNRRHLDPTADWDGEQIYDMKTPPKVDPTGLRLSKTPESLDEVDDGSTAVSKLQDPRYRNPTKLPPGRANIRSPRIPTPWNTHITTAPYRRSYETSPRNQSSSWDHHSRSFSRSDSASGSYDISQNDDVPARGTGWQKQRKRSAAAATTAAAVAFPLIPQTPPHRGQYRLMSPSSATTHMIENGIPSGNHKRSGRISPYRSNDMAGQIHSEDANHRHHRDVVVGRCPSPYHEKRLQCQLKTKQIDRKESSSRHFFADETSPKVDFMELPAVKQSVNFFSSPKAGIRQNARQEEDNVRSNKLKEMSSMSFDRKVHIPPRAILKSPPVTRQETNGNYLIDGDVPSNVAVINEGHRNHDRRMAHAQWQTSGQPQSPIEGKTLMFVTDEQRTYSLDNNAKLVHEAMDLESREELVDVHPNINLNLNKTKKPKTKIGFFSKILSGGNQGDTKNTSTPNEGREQQQKVSSIPHHPVAPPQQKPTASNGAGLVSRTQLVQQGWNPDNVDHHDEPVSDMSLFGRLVALQSKNKTKRQTYEDVHEVDLADSDSRYSGYGGDWEVVSRESQCLTEESDPAKSKILRHLAESNSFERRSGAPSASFSASISHDYEDDGSSVAVNHTSKPMKLKLSTERLTATLDDTDTKSPKRKGMFSRILSPRNQVPSNQKNIEEHSKLTELDHSAFASSIAASKGSQSAPSMSMSAYSVASGSTSSDIVPPSSTKETNRESIPTGKGSNAMNDRIERVEKRELKSLADDASSFNLPKTRSPEANEKRNVPISSFDAEQQEIRNKSKMLIEEMLLKKSPKVTKAENQIKRYPSSIMSAESDDDIPDPGVSVQELRNMLGTTKNNLAEIKDTPSVIAPATETSQPKEKKGIFGIPLYQKNAQPENEEKSVDQKDKENASSISNEAPQSSSTADNQTEEEFGLSLKKEDLEDVAKRPLLDSGSATSVSSKESLTVVGDVSAYNNTSDAMNVVTQGNCENNPNESENIESKNEEGSDILKDLVAAETPVTSNASNIEYTLEDHPLEGSMLERKNVRFSEFLETVRHIPAQSASFSTHDSTTPSLEGVVGLKQISVSPKKKKKIGKKKKLMLSVSSLKNRLSKLSPGRGREDHGEMEEKETSLDDIPEDDEIVEEYTSDTTKGDPTESSYHKESNSMSQSESDDMTPNEYSDQEQHQQQRESLESTSGIEMIARRTKAGKNAILISETEDHPQKESSIPRSRATKQSKVSSNRSLSSSSTRNGSAVSMSSASSRSSHSRKRRNRSQMKQGLLYKLPFFGRKSNRQNRNIRRRSTNRQRRPRQHPASRYNDVRNRRHMIDDEEKNPTAGESSIYFSTAGSSMTSVVRNGNATDRRRNNKASMLESVTEDVESFMSRSSSPSLNIPQTDSITSLSYIADNSINASSTTSKQRQPQQFVRELSGFSRASSAFSSAYDADYSRGGETSNPSVANTRHPRIQQDDQTSVVSDDWFSWLLPGLFSPIPKSEIEDTKPTTTIERTLNNDNMPPRQSSTNTRKTRSTMGSSYDDISHDFTQSTPSTVVAADAIKLEEEKHVIDTRQWQEILDATEVLALKYKEQKNQKHQQPSQKKKPSSVQISSTVEQCEFK